VEEVQEKKEERLEERKREVLDRNHKDEYVQLQSSERATDCILNIVPKDRQHTAAQNKQVMQHDK
jgi:hypothetical protein